jgi:hypothetical protein
MGAAASITMEAGEVKLALGANDELILTRAHTSTLPVDCDAALASITLASVAGNSSSSTPLFVHFVRGISASEQLSAGEAQFSRPTSIPRRCTRVSSHVQHPFLVVAHVFRAGLERVIAPDRCWRCGVSGPCSTRGD